MAEAAYNNYGAEDLYNKYNLALFDSEAQKKPKIREVPPEIKKRKTVERAEKYIDAKAREINKNRQESALKLKIVAVTVSLMLTFLGVSVVLLSQQANIDATRTQISQSKNDLAILKGETTRLKNELSATASSQNVEKYAQEKLGLVKAEAYQIVYINTGSEDKIVVSGGKEVKK